jgi:hypothetical protein
MKITKNKDSVIVELPLLQKESNCYMEDSELQDVPNLWGVNTGREFTISQRINMRYAG